MAVYEVPLSATPQTFEISLAGRAYRLTVMYRDAEEGGWMLDIASAKGVAILQGLPLVPGVDLLRQYGYLDFGGALVVQTDNDADAEPTFDNLGDLSHLYFVTP